MSNMTTILSWNVNGIRAAEKKGYSGVAIFSKKKPINVKYGFGIKEFDSEGRIIIAEYENFFLFNIYYPNGKMNPDRLKFKLDFYKEFLNCVKKISNGNINMGGHEGRPYKTIIVCGDVNTAHNEIDLSRPKENENTSGFLREERKWLDEFKNAGLVDTFRYKYPDKAQFSWWDLKTRARDRNIGWRIDYFYIDAKHISLLEDAFMMSDVFGSDHCPIGIRVNLL